jgi:hypothetical protein
VTVFNKRNALIGFLTLEMLKRRRRARLLRRRRPRIAAFSLLGLVSVVAFVGIVAVVLRRRGNGETPAIVEEDSEIVGEYVTASAEPFPAA